MQTSFIVQAIQSVYQDVLTHEADIEKLDKLIQETDKGQRIPILLKKYIGLNAKLLSFNVDPLFNNCLDGFIFLDYHLVPEKVKEGLRK